MSRIENSFADLIEVRMRLCLDSPFSTLMNLKNSSLFQCYKIFKNDYERPSGYITWANVNKESFSRLSVCGGVPKYSYEWNEGNLVYLTEFLNSGRSNFSLRREFRLMFRKRRVVMFVRNGCVRIYVRKNSKFILQSRLDLEKC